MSPCIARLQALLYCFTALLLYCFTALPLYRFTAHRPPPTASLVRPKKKRPAHSGAGRVVFWFGCDYRTYGDRNRCSSSIRSVILAETMIIRFSISLELA